MARSYASTLPNDLMRHLLIMLETETDNHTFVSQYFIIQYTYFEFNIDSNIWVMKTFLDIGPETIRYCNLSISTVNTTKILIYGKNPKFGILTIDKKLDMRGKSQPNKIYACDLYIDFEPLHYYGTCYTG
jgi:hypothetical protein